MPFDTLESAQAEIIRLTDLVTDLETQRDTLSQNNETLANDLNQARTLNQQYFNRLIAQDSAPEGKPTEDNEPVPCEDFAKTLKF